jgi:hypothetical protein
MPAESGTEAQTTASEPSLLRLTPLPEEGLA